MPHKGAVAAAPESDIPPSPPMRVRVSWLNKARGKAMLKRLTFAAASMLVTTLPLPCAAEPSANAGFDCRVARTPVEHLICSSPELSEADARMAKNYRALSTLLDQEERHRTQAEQRDWLRSRDRDCRGDDATWCLTLKTLERGTVLRSRIQAMSTVNSAPSPRQISRDEAIRLCDEVVALANRGTLTEAAVPDAADDANRIAIEWALQSQRLWRFHRFQGMDGRPRRFGSVVEGMSCPSEILFDYDHALASGSAELGSLGDDPDIDREVGREDRLLNIKGEPVVVRGNAYQVSWFGEERQRPLCALRQTGKVEYRLQSAEEDDVCRAVVRGEVSPLPWSEWNGKEPALLVGLPNREGGLGGVVEANLDGTARVIGLWVSATTSGCGRDRQWLVEIDPSGRQAEPTPFSRALNEQEWQGVDGGRVGLIAYRNRAYVLGKRDEETGLYSVERGRLRRVCLLEALPQVELGATFIK